MAARRVIPRTCPTPRKFVDRLADWYSRTRSSTCATSRSTCRPRGSWRINTSVVDPGFEEDKWVQAVEARPGNRACGASHHRLRAAAGPARRRLPGRRRAGRLCARRSPHCYPPGMATFVAAGSKIIFQMHYTPNGTAQQDRSYIGAQVRRSEASVKRRRSGGAAGDRWFQIPPGDDNHEVNSEHTFGKDSAPDLALPAHAPARQGVPLRGPLSGRRRRNRSWTCRITISIGSCTIELAEPKLIPKGTRLRVHGALRQLGREPGESQPEGHGPLGRSDVGRDDDRILFHDPDERRHGDRSGPGRRGRRRREDGVIASRRILPQGFDAHARPRRRSTSAARRRPPAAPRPGELRGQAAKGRPDRDAYLLRVCHRRARLQAEKAGSV